jgi:hypothetical protein
MELMELLEELVEEILLRISPVRPSPHTAGRTGVSYPRHPRLQVMVPHPLRPQLPSQVPRVPLNAALARLPLQPLLSSWPDPSVCPDDIHGPLFSEQVLGRMLIRTF